MSINQAAIQTNSTDTIRNETINFSMQLLNSELEEDENNPFKPKTKKEILERIDHSLAQAEAGDLQDADEALEEILAEL